MAMATAMATANAETTTTTAATAAANTMAASANDEGPLRAAAEDADVEESPAREGRSENSLAYLCQRFCDLYRDHSEPINIDLAAKELGIQRRRMYEILNIIQSVGLVTRLRSSFYRWEGDAKMAQALERLKDEGLGRLVAGDAAIPATTATTIATPKAGTPPATPEGQRKKAVATALGERFVQVFLCNEVPQPIVLEDIMGLFSSCVAGSSGQTNQMSCARRLYDIANVFCAIGLVAKTGGPLTDQRRKKRFYEWTGPVLPASATPMRPAVARSGVTAASPAAGSAKRAKRAAHETPPVRKRAKLRLTDSPRRVKTEPPVDGKSESKRVFMVLPHPSVAALPGTRRLSLTFNDKSKDKSKSTSSHRTESDEKHADESTFLPTNAKDGALELPLAPLLAAASRPEQQPEPESVPDHSTSSCPSTDAPQKPATSAATATTTTTTAKAEGDDASALLKAQVEQLTKALEDARERERDLLKRIEMQDAQINKLLDLKHSSSSNSTNERRYGRDRASSTASTPSGFALRGALSGFSPLTTLALSPCQSVLGRDPFGLVSPSPFSGSFTTGLTGSGPASSSSSRRPPTARKARIGPQIVDPTTTTDEDAKHSQSQSHLSPHTTSVAASLLLSPLQASSLEKDKENRLDRFLSLTSSPAPRSSAAVRSVASVLSSPALARVALTSSAPGTPPSHLIATAASSLLSLTPTQGRHFLTSPSSFFGTEDDASPTRASETRSVTDDDRASQAPTVKEEREDTTETESQRASCCSSGESSQRSTTSAFDAPPRARLLSDCLS